MSIKEYIQQTKENLLKMELKSKSFVIMVISIILVSMIFTPFIGIPAGLFIGSYVQSNS